MMSIAMSMAIPGPMADTRCSGDGGHTRGEREHHDPDFLPSLMALIAADTRWQRPGRAQQDDTDTAGEHPQQSRQERDR
ncbi:MAG TPA: hypothetical protein VL027_09695 [Spongiibacteraceae bacterium]|nr:hypothetical protein [Spongiibacteraceae bacterium]HUH38202.1 hypothetical protein [Spongiibacteraceae bacterium]